MAPGSRAASATVARRTAGVKVVGYLLVLFQRILPAVALDADELAVDALGPAAEVVNFAANLLLPGAGQMGVRGIPDTASWGG